MTFHSSLYLFFLPVVVVLHFLLPYRARWILLLAASYMFYAAWRVEFLSLVVLSTATDYLAALGIEAARTARRRKAVLVVSLTINLGLLFVFKYVSALWDGIGLLAQWAFSASPQTFPHFDILLPLGISFYTFQTMSYTIDVYRRRIPAERHFGYFALYVAFFPQFLAGPIERAGHLLSELRLEQRFNWASLGPAVFLITLGLAKKLVISDRLAGLLTPITADPLRFSPLEVVLTPPATVYQYYCDLSGYADIALGSAMLLGVRLSRNFDRPFAASSTARFWYRWHVTVTAWFRDYLMRPLMRSGSVTATRPGVLIITGMVIGLWHGPTLGWAVAGCTVGIFAICESKWSRWRVRTGFGPRTGLQRLLWGWSGRLYVWMIVFFLIGLPLTWADIGTLTAVLRHIGGLDLSSFTAVPLVLKMHEQAVPMAIGLIVLLEVWQWMDARGWTARAAAAACPEVRWVSCALFAFVVMALADLSQSGFLYFKF